MAIASLILGIISVILAFFSVIFSYMSSYLAIPGLILGIIAYIMYDNNDESTRKMALAGIILNILGILIGLIMSLFWALILSMA